MLCGLDDLFDHRRRHGDTEFGLLLGIPILSGSLSRLALGMLADRYGGRIVFVGVMLASAASTFLLSIAFGLTAEITGLWTSCFMLLFLVVSLNLDWMPLIITVGVFGAFGGAPQTMAGGKEIWLQNAGFIWVPKSPS